MREYAFTISFYRFTEALSPQIIASKFLVAELDKRAEDRSAALYIDVPLVRRKLYSAMKHRLAALCIGLAPLDLPVLLVVEILFALGDSYERFTMHKAWKIGKLVKQSAVRLTRYKLQ